jgi:hypothetical protein
MHTTTLQSQSSDFSAGGLLVLTCLAILALGTPAAAQAPPIGGLTGTIALEGTVDQAAAAAGTVVVKAADGTRHVFRVARNLVVHGGHKPAPTNDVLSDLRPGSTIVVHYSGSGANATAQEIDRVGDDGLKVSEGMVTSINRGKQEITIRLDDKRIETLQLTERAARDVGADLGASGERIVVYYTDVDGRKVAHYFRKKPS